MFKFLNLHTKSMTSCMRNQIANFNNTASTSVAATRDVITKTLLSVRETTSYYITKLLIILSMDERG